MGNSNSRRATNKSNITPESSQTSRKPPRSTLSLDLSNSNVLVIGRNKDNELCLTNKEIQETLCIFDGVGFVDHLVSGKAFTIYVDDNKDCFAIEHDIWGHYSGWYEYDFWNTQHKIQHIFTNVASSSLFFMYNNGDIYGTRCNASGQLGIKTADVYSQSQRYVVTPVPIDDLMYEHIMDIQCAESYSIAVAKPSSVLMKGFCRRHVGIILDDDVISVILAFWSGSSNVYVAGLQDHGKFGWRKLKGLDNKEVTQARCGRFHSLFLESNGKLWSYGTNWSNQLGCIDDQQNTNMRKFETIHPTYFIKHRIQIKAIACGYYHNLAVDHNQKVYTWGDNQFGQCGDDSTTNLKAPQIVKSLRKYDVKDIGCGANHSYVMTHQSKHFLFGSNEYNECITYNGERKIKIPHCINEIIDEQTNGKKIKRVCLGVHNTKIIMCRKISSLRLCSNN
eukprot:252421_1